MLLLAHGLVTPGVLGRPGNLWVSRLPVLSVAAFAVASWLVHRRAAERVARPRAHHHERVDGERWLVAAEACHEHRSAADGRDHSTAAGPH